MGAKTGIYMMEEKIDGMLVYSIQLDIHQRIVEWNLPSNQLYEHTVADIF